VQPFIANTDWNWFDFFSEKVHAELAINEANF